MKKLCLYVLGFSMATAQAQHQHHQMPTADSTRNRADTTGHSMHQHQPMQHDMSQMAHGLNHGLTMDTSMGMTHSLSRNLSMNRNGSGTAWHPDYTPMYAYMTHPANRNGWSYMLHYAVYLRYTSQNLNNANRAGHAQQLGAPNWVMGMAQKPVGRRGLFQVRAMFSLDPLLVGNGGYPLLFQTGESYKGQPLVNRQHPHDFISELSVSYAHALSKDADVYGYFGFPGEPAIGPPAFMHRISSFNNPDAPIGHHWQDATHITFGVATLGFRYKWVKLEGSTFKGREPDEYRWGFDKPQFDSYAYRVSVNPSAAWALQFSQAAIKSPEALHPSDDVQRTTASVLHSKGLNPNSYITSALVWGRNVAHGEKADSYLAESSLQLNKLAFYGRYEYVQKSAEELRLVDHEVHDPYIPHDPFGDNPILNINQLTLGLNYRVAQVAKTDMVLGAQLTGGLPDKRLEAIYGKQTLSGQVYLRLSPSLLNMNHMSRHSHQTL